MRHKSFAQMNCSIAQCLEVVGEWWTLLIVRDAFFGISRFVDFEARLGISRNVLTQRLDHLVENEILERMPYQDHPVRYDYRLTRKGRDLWHVMTAMRQWGDRWAAPDGPPIELVHEQCGKATIAVPACSRCAKTLHARDVRAVAGPGARDERMLPPAVARTARSTR